ncbi:MAG: SIS domain-containing protein [Nitrospinaceae bacterium]|jgi:D-sedoheptulose 7-phosphate isomerase|nr:SIS domain-containing protein [Nitrospinaceae bacterium]MBT3433518.1 SIS domain-containing protein [Nitrospinaceae bacterium]MBT3822517.1 SIS domain-containing protein [Nitrospinaceae bacterium]MBT4093637.1 SIS domain-containing protein [Nitrospinaceae bacterium]MBT5367179.1 SIS domain-containing protein [Nitrospinaceae bacterium]
MGPLDFTNMKAETYFGQLGSLLLETQVTQSGGAALSLEEGMARAAQMVLSLVPAKAGASEAEGSLPKAMIIGNGGSAAIASHIQNDMCKSVGVPTMVFNEPALLTALANDDGYDTAFRQMVEMWAGPDDLLMAISSSGKSANILGAVEAACSRGCRVITFSGFSPDNSLRGMGDLNFHISSDSYGLVEVAHMALAHYVTDSAMHNIDKGRN